jgi:hypothetical protein
LNIGSETIQNGTSSYFKDKYSVASAQGSIDYYNIRRGTVDDPKDTLTSITKEINYFYGTKLTEDQVAQINNISNKNGLRIGTIIRVGTIDKYGNIWIPSYSRAEINADYLRENMTTEEQTRILNYHRNIFEDWDLPRTLNELLTAEKILWKGGDIAPAHNIGTSGNIEYRGIYSRIGQQIIFDVNGNLVTTNENKGTFDYVPPKIGDYTDHFIYDVIPWIKYGNNPQDTSTPERRYNGLNNDPWGKFGLFWWREYLWDTK